MERFLYRVDYSNCTKLLIRRFCVRVAAGAQKKKRLERFFFQVGSQTKM